MKKIFIVLAFFIFLCSSIMAQDADLMSFARPELVKKFHIDIPQSKIDSIMSKVKNASLPIPMPRDNKELDAWESGMDVQWLAELQKYWLNSYNWRNQEKLLNSYPLYIADVDGYKVQFYFVRGEGKNPLPMVLTHGWPGSTFEFFNVIEPLTHPSKFGGDKEKSFSLIIPSLPGFGFSSMPAKPVNAITTARLWNGLITKIIGFKSYVAQGGDWGAGVTVYLAHQYPQNVKAINLNFFPGVSVPDSVRTDAEKQYFSDIANFQIPGFDYWRIQADKPLMAGTALRDSPLGTAGWISEKFWAWTDHGEKLETVIDKDRLLTDIMLYLVNDAGIDGSFWYYRGFFSEVKGISTPGYISVPTSISIFPKDLPLSKPPLETVKRMYNVFSFSHMPKGGHFAAMEQPKIFVEEIQKVFKKFH